MNNLLAWLVVLCWGAGQLGWGELAWAQPAQPVNATDTISPQDLNPTAPTPIRYVYDIDWPPFEMKSEVDDHVGIIADILQLVADKTGLQFEPIHTASWQQAVTLAEQGIADMYSAIPQDSERGEYMNFTRNDIFTYYAALVKSADDATDYRQLASTLSNKTIAVVRASSLGKRVRQQLQNSASDIRFIEVDNTTAGFDSVFQGRADLFAINSVSAEYQLTRRYPTLLVAAKLAQPLHLKIALSKKLPTEKLAQIDAALQQIGETELDAIYNKWVYLDPTLASARANLLTREEVEYLKQKRVLNTHLEADWIPFAFYENDQPAGFLYDLQTLFARKAGLELRVQKLSFEQALKALESQQIDVMFEADDTFKETMNVHMDERVLYQYVDTLISRNNLSFGGLGGKKVGYIAGAEYYYQAYDELATADMRPYTEATPMISDVASGKLDAALNESHNTAAIIERLAVGHLVQANTYGLYTNISLMKAGFHPNAKRLQSIYAKLITQQDLKDLKKKWGLTQSQQAYELTETEKHYLQANNVFTVCDRYRHYPLSATQGDTLIGIAGEVFERLSRDLGVEFKAIEADSPQNFIEHINENRCELISIIKKDFNELENFTATQPYTQTTQFVAIGSSHTAFMQTIEGLPNAQIYVKGSLHKAMLKKQYPGLKVIIEPDVDRIFEAVEHDRNSFYVLPYIVADYLIQQYGPKEFRIVDRLEKIEADASIGVNMQTAPILLGILNKALNKMGEQELHSISDRYKLKSYQITHYGWLWYVVGLSVFLLIGLQLRHTYSMRQQLKQERIILEKFDDAQRLSNIGHWAISAGSDEPYLSPNLRAMFEFGSQEDVTLQDIIAKVHQDDRANFIEVFQKKFGQPELVENDYRIVIKKGVRYIHSEWRQTFDKRGDIVATNGFCQDITDKVSAEINRRLLDIEKKHAAEISRANRDLTKMTEQQRHLFAIIGHELRTPSAAMNMMLKREEPDIPLLLETSEHLLNVLDDMRAVIHPEEAIKGKIVSGTVYSIVKHALKYQSHLLQESGLEVRVEAGQSAQCLCQVNAQLLRQIILNLIKNCALHSHAKTLIITISQLDEHPCHYQIQFTDDGQGIDAELQGRLFDSFARGDTQTDGSGLGLHLSRQFARQALNGDLTYQDNPSGGARFNLTLRLTPSAKKQATAGAQLPSGFLAGQRILLAEDNELIRLMTEQLLRDYRADVDSAENGAIAFEMFKQRNYDLVVTDIFMPEMDGYTLTKNIRAQGFKGLIVGVTAATVGDELSKLKAAGANEMLSKPLDVPKLFSAMQNAGINMAAQPVVEPEESPVEAPVESSIESSIESVKPESLTAKQIAKSATEKPKSPLNAPIDILALQELCLDNDSLKHRMFGIFLNQSDEHMQALTNAINSENWLEAKRVAHMLKGSARTLFANDLADAFHALEHTLIGHDASEVEGAYATVKAQCHRVRAFIDSQMGEVAKS